MTARAVANGNGAGAFDLEAAAEAAAREAKAAPFLFTYKGSNYQVPPSQSWPVEVMDLIAKGDLSEGLSRLIGAEQWQQLTEAGITVGALNTLFDEVAKASGLEALPPSSGPQLPAMTRK